MTNEDITNHAMAILKSKQEQERLTTEANAKGRAPDATTMKVLEKDVEVSAVALAINVLTNINSIAQSLETIAKASLPGKLIH